MPENKLTVFISRAENTAARRNEAAPVSLIRRPRKNNLFRGREKLDE
jgi:hypothetical protein